jgi:hypothetical protein
MNEDNTDTGVRKGRWLIGVLSLLTIIIVISSIWAVFAKTNKTTTQNTQPTKNNEIASVNALISYSLPAGWNVVTCNNPNETTLIVPDSKVSPDCSTLADSWPTKMMIDPKNTRDCHQIKVNNQQITSHTCSSKFVNNNKTLVSITKFNDKSAYGKNTDVTDYYILTNKGVVNLHYADDVSSPEDDYQAEFDQIANSIKVK